MKWVIGYFPMMKHPISGPITGIILRMGTANDRRYNITSYIIGWARTQNDQSIISSGFGVTDKILMLKSSTLLANV